MANATFKKPATAGKEGYEYLASGYLWKMTVPLGGSRKIVLSEDPPTPDVKTVRSNCDAISPHVPPEKSLGIWDTEYTIVGSKLGVMMLEARDAMGAVATFIQVQVVDPGPAGAGAAAGGAATLGFRTTSFTRSLGDYDWKIEWILNNANASTNGFIVQKVIFDSKTTNAAGQPTNDSITYWEAWQVRKGVIFAGTSNTQVAKGDEFTSTGTQGTKGTITATGEAKFIQDYKEPEKWSTGAVKMASSLRATTLQPPGWTNAGVVKRSIAVTYDSTVTPPVEGPIFRVPQR